MKRDADGRERLRGPRRHTLTRQEEYAMSFARSSHLADCAECRLRLIGGAQLGAACRLNETSGLIFDEVSSDDGADCAHGGAHLGAECSQQQSGGLDSKKRKRFDDDDSDDSDSASSTLVMAPPLSPYDVRSSDDSTRIFWESIVSARLLSWRGPRTEIPSDLESKTMADVHGDHDVAAGDLGVNERAAMIRHDPVGYDEDAAASAMLEAASNQQQRVGLDAQEGMCTWPTHVFGSEPWPDFEMITVYSSTDDRTWYLPSRWGRQESHVPSWLSHHGHNLSRNVNGEAAQLGAERREQPRVDLDVSDTADTSMSVRAWDARADERKRLRSEERRLRTMLRAERHQPSSGRFFIGNNAATTQDVISHLLRNNLARSLAFRRQVIDDDTQWPLIEC